MVPLGAFAAVILGWLWWSGRIRTQNILPLMAAVGGLIGLVRGITPLAVIGVAGAAYLIWQMGRKARQTPEQKLALARAEAERLLALPPEYNMEMLDAAYRFAAKQAHPDTGGDAAQLAALTEARDVLKARLLQPPES